MRAAVFFSALVMAYAGAGHAALGGPPEQFSAEGTTVVASVSNYLTRETTLATGTQVREYVSAGGVVELTLEGYGHRWLRARPRG